MKYWYIEYQYKSEEPGRVLVLARSANEAIDIWVRREGNCLNHSMPEGLVKSVIQAPDYFVITRNPEDIPF